VLATGGLGAQELPPAGVGVAARRRWDPVALEDASARRGASTVAEFEQLALAPGGTSSRSPTTDTAVPAAMWGATTKLARAATPRHLGMYWCRGAPVARAARERHITVARNDDRVRNLAGFGGIGGALAALVGNPDRPVSGMTTRRSVRSASGGAPPAAPGRP
jgi:hypothetical protein